MIEAGPLLSHWSLARKRDRGVTAKDTRLFLEAVLWRVRVGGPYPAR